MTSWKPSAPVLAGVGGSTPPVFQEGSVWWLPRSYLLGPRSCPNTSHPQPHGKSGHEPALCSRVSNRPRTHLSITVAAAQLRLRRGPALATLSAATGAGRRVPSPGTQHAPLPAATLSPTRPPHAAAGAGAGRARCPLGAGCRGEGLRERGGAARSCCSGPAAGSKQPLHAASTGQGTREAAPAPASDSAGFIAPNCRQQKAPLPSPWPLLQLQWKTQLQFPAPATAQDRDNKISKAPGPVRSARPRGLLQRGTLAQHGPGSRSADEAAATSAAAVPPAPALRQPALPLPVLLYKPGPAFWEAAPSRWLWRLSLSRLEKPCRSTRLMRAWVPSPLGWLLLLWSRPSSQRWNRDAESTTQARGLLRLHQDRQTSHCSLRFSSKLWGTGFETGKGHPRLTLSNLQREIKATRKTRTSQGPLRALLHRQASSAGLRPPRATLLSLCLKESGRTVATGGWAGETEARGPQHQRQNVTPLLLVRQHRNLFCWEHSSWSKENPFFHRITRMKSQFSIQKVLMENLCLALLLNTDWRYLDFWGKEGQVIFTVWKMKLTEFIFLCEAMIDFSVSHSYCTKHV